MYLAPPMPPKSPISVRFASALLFGVAGLSLLSAVVELVFVNTDLSVYRDAYTGGTGSGFRSIVSATTDIFLAGGAGVLAVLNGQGRKNARVAAYVLGGIFLICGGLGNLSDPFRSPSESAGSGWVERITPAAYGLSAGLLDALTALATLTALVLLALPPSNRFFQICERNRYVLILAPQPRPFRAGAQPEQEPHTGSIPPTDPWAEPGPG
ncbi:hypothetical protein ACWKSP_40195 [Micromonosporaceae bacterium Da 78-11]